MKTVVLFQGGGALGAFGCGVWEVLAPWLARRGDRIVALAGSSIGALNAAVVRTHLDAPDSGVEALTALWRERIATPSIPFAGMAWGDSEAAACLRSWNGFLTGMLAGNRGLFVPRFSTWNPWSMLQRLQQPLYDRSRMWALLEEVAPPYRSHAPEDVLLAAGSSQIRDGSLRLSDSDRADVGPREVAASAALPLLFDPVEIDGELQWDGEIVRQSPIGPLVHKVRDSGRVAPGEPLQLITIEQLPRPMERLPVSGPEMAYRALNLGQVDKLVPSAELVASEGVRWVRIAREPLPWDGIAGQFDYSPQRIDELIAQGAADAKAALGGASDAVAKSLRLAGAEPDHHAALPG